MAKSKKSSKRKVKTTKKAASKTAKAPMTFIVIQGVSPKLKAGWFARAKRKGLTFSAWAREALGAR